MREHRGPIYEVTLHVEDDAAAGLDEWLGHHVGEMLQIPGFEDADISRLDDESGRQARVVRYYLASDEALADYLAGPAAAMRQKTANQFGEHFEATRRTLLDSTRPVEDAPQHCLNCDSLLTGQYCGECGQRADSRLISVWELFKDAFSDLLDVDSRVWRTMHQLALRPGQLTRDYLRGRRARYIPPFRMYLVMSLVFFVVAFFDPREQFSLFFEPEIETADQQAERAAKREQVLKELADEGIVVTPPGEENDEPGFRMTIDGEEVDADCGLENYNPDELPGFLGRRLSRDRMQTVCNRMFGEGGVGVRGFLDKLLEYIPAGLFVLLPLMALVLKALYPLSKRYYVEHLLFVLHYHAFVFLALLTQILVSHIGDTVKLPGWTTGLLGLAIFLYVPVYLYKALRRIYEQGHLLTIIKFLLMLVAYGGGLLIMFATMAVVAAFSI